MKLVPTALRLLAIFPVLAAPALAQQPAPVVPQVIAVGRGEVELKPDRARIEFGVETRAQTAAAAAAENSRRQRAILDTLQRLGVGADQLQTSALQVTPEMVYPGQGQAPRVSGYVARNSVRVEVLKLEQTGTLVDVALTKGATNIAGLQFYSTRALDARREALEKAVTAARLDAETMVKAAGCQLGTLIEISGGAFSESPVMLAMDAVQPRFAAAAPPPPINPGVLKVVETVTVRWAVRQ